ncbi:MAG: SMP-30/gluconolactonase/LRE family protein [Bryobacteraceae bacterium]
MIEAKSERLWELIPRNAEVKQVAGGFQFTEGPVFSRRGYLLFSDIPAERIHKWERGKLTVFREKSGLANGLTFDHQGRLLTCEGAGRVTRTEKNGSITVLAAEGLGKPNDLVYAIDGSVYFTDLPKSRVYQITRTNRSGGKVRLVAEDCPGPNGVALSPDQFKLFVADSKTRKVRLYPIEPDGALGQGRDFAETRCDGLKTDEGGNVWVAAGEGIRVYSAAGEELGLVRTPESASNCSWGAGFRGLYITAQKSVYHVPTRASGTRTF